MTTVKHVSEDVAWYALSPEDVAGADRCRSGSRAGRR